MVRGIGFRIPMKEAVRMTVATEAGFARLLGMFKPGDNYLVVLPSEGSNEVNYVRTAGLGEEWDESVREGGPPHVIIESFLDRAKPIYSELDQAILDGMDPLGGNGTLPDVDQGTTRSLEVFDTQ